MAVTKSGIYHNLAESKYTISNGEVVFFFSSKVYLNKFLEKYMSNRTYFRSNVGKVADVSELNMNVLADISLYETIEKRGYHAWLKSITVNKSDLHLYALRKMTLQNTPDWYEMQKPKLAERVKSMGLT